ncbi:MAG: phosphate ABC transporter substrate-binding protein PstS [Burkholderiales bacterium]|nr:phosphate ABC transporter substrate-binding protein PstS [Burkholderiales bacterium]
MNRLRTLLSLLAFVVPTSQAIEIHGAGSSAAAPLYKIWADAYAKNSKDSVDYQATGSSAGIKKIKENGVDFGASDAALSLSDLKKAKLIQFPSAISGVVPVINLPGVRTGTLHLTGDILAGIFSAKITQWNDAAIVAANPGVHVPVHAIEVIVRQDGSGTTYNFTDYLSKVNPAWQMANGRNFTINWNPRLTQVKGSGGVSAAVRKTAYSISYIDYNYVVQDKLDFALVQNRDGRFPLPGPESFSIALSGSSWKTQANFEEMLTDKPGVKAWPITMGTFILLPQAAVNVEKTSATLKFFTWAFMNGDKFVNSVDFVRLPDALQARVFKEMTTVTDQNGKPLHWSLP